MWRPSKDVQNKTPQNIYIYIYSKTYPESYSTQNVSHFQAAFRSETGVPRKVKPRQNGGTGSTIADAWESQEERETGHGQQTG